MAFSTQFPPSPILLPRGNQCYSFLNAGINKYTHTLLIFRFSLSLKNTFYFCVGIWVDVCMRTGAHEEGAGSPGTGVTGGCEHLMWVLRTKHGSPARAVCAPLTTEPSLRCLSFILTMLRIKPKALYMMNNNNNKNASIYCIDLYIVKLCLGSSTPESHFEPLVL